MRRLIKYFAAGVCWILWFLLIDGSGVGFREQMRKIREWAEGPQL